MSLVMYSNMITGEDILLGDDMAFELAPLFCRLSVHIGRDGVDRLREVELFRIASRPASVGPCRLS